MMRAPAKQSQLCDADEITIRDSVNEYPSIGMIASASQYPLEFRL
jgi:hypothetical protein